MVKLSFDNYLDKIKGCWFGKCFGGAAGAPYEGFKEIINFPPIEEVMRPDLPNDDLDIQLLWLEVLQKKGIRIDSIDLAEAWKEKCPYTMSEYGYFLKNYDRGIIPPASGWFNNSFFKDGNGCPIRAEIWGLINPFAPENAARYAEMDGSLDHFGEPVFIEVFFSALISLSFGETDLVKLVESARTYLPENSKANFCVLSLLRWHEEYPDDFTIIREKAVAHFGHNDFTNAIINLAFVLIGLLYGEKDIRKTVETALYCGYDADCTCATAAALVGCVVGFSNIPQELKHLVGDGFVSSVKLDRDLYTIDSLSDDVAEIGLISDKINGKNRLCPSGTNIKKKTSTELSPQISINVEYLKDPCLGMNSPQDFRIIINNKTEKDKPVWISINKGNCWTKLIWEKRLFQLNPGEKIQIDNQIQITGHPEILESYTKLEINLEDIEGSLLLRKTVGFAVADIWQISGPFFSVMPDPVQPENYPNPHGENTNLPSLESMVNNYTEIEEKYLDENDIDEALSKNDNAVSVEAFEDIIPDLPFGYTGQACFYASRKFYSNYSRKIWLVIGNTDAYKIWINGEPVQTINEIRLWTPYNNSVLIDLKQGINSLVVKMLRRTEFFKFSVGLREYNNKHWHQNKWIVDLKGLTS